MNVSIVAYEEKILPFSHKVITWRHKRNNYTLKLTVEGHIPGCLAIKFLFGYSQKIKEKKMILISYMDGNNLFFPCFNENLDHELNCFKMETSPIDFK